MLSIFLFLVGVALFASVQAQTTTYVEPNVPTGVPIPGNYTGELRPQIHFSPPQHFMNDPNGMFLDQDGVYHLYYQYNPTGNFAGNQHWGHATSKDLYHWENQQIAIFPGSPREAIFSGSAVIDVNNTSGFFPNQTNGVVAIYTVNTAEEQNQQIAYSIDGGYTFTKYSGNPVIRIDSNQFRDPQVTWHAPTENWVMVVAYAQDFVIGVFTSPDLKAWTHASNFSHHGILGNQYECPNMVEIPMSGSDETMHLLIISINPGAPLGGSITQYFPGHFNGTVFTPVDGAARIADFGKDNYAGQFFYGTPKGSNPISLAWTSNWQYAQSVPTGPQEGWRSSMSLPKTNMLKNITRIGYTLVQKPVDFSSLYERPLAQNSSFGNGTIFIDYSGVESRALYFQANFSGIPDANVTGTTNFTFMSSISGESVRGGFYFNPDTQFWLDRGNTYGFDNPFFTNKFSTSIVISDGMWMLEGVIDRSLLEVWLDGATHSATASFFPQRPLDTMVFSTARLNSGVTVSIAVWALKSAWADQANVNGTVVGNNTMFPAMKKW